MKGMPLFLKLFIGLFFIFSCNQTRKREATAITHPSDYKQDSSRKLNRSDFLIITTNHYPAAQNFHILLKWKLFRKDSIQVFVDQFRDEFCSGPCNISIYDDVSIKSLITKYPLTDSEYLIMADHLVATSIFDMTDVSFYPYQDVKYQELGGKNWKIDPDTIGD